METRTVRFRSPEWAYLIETGWQTLEHETLEHDGELALMVRDETYHASAYDVLANGQPTVPMVL